MISNKSYSLKTKPNLRARIRAGVVDYGIIYSYTIVIFYFFGEPDEGGGHSVNEWPGLSIMIFWFFMTIIMEQFFGGTLGNRLNNLEVWPKDSPRQDITFSQSVKRHLLDPFDLGLIFPAIITIKNTEFNQRIGDLWAKTVVINKLDKEQGLIINSEEQFEE